MDATCERCGKPMPDFARVCESCGHHAAEQLELPSLTLPGDSDEESKGHDSFDFTHEVEPVNGGEIDILDDPATSETRAADNPAMDHEPVLAEDADESVPAAALDFVQPEAAIEPPTAPPTGSDLSVFALSDRVPVAPISAAAPRSRKREIAMVTIAATLSGILTLGLLLMRAAPASDAAAVKSASASTVERGAPVSSAAVTTWSAANSALWAGPQKHSIAFEVEAENTVSVWMRTVRPTLVVRCTAGSIEAFVFTASAARIEPKTEDHTVQFGFDAGTMWTERWRDSEEHDALFAPDGTAFVRQLLTAKAFRFGFTPHNAAAVTARFSVVGLRGMLDGARRQCGKF